MPGSTDFLAVRFLTVPTVAEYLGVSQGTIRRWIKEAKIPVVRLGKCVRFDPRSLEEWLARRWPDE